MSESVVAATDRFEQAPGYSELTVHMRAVNPSGKYPRNRIAFRFKSSAVVNGDPVEK